MWRRLAPLALLLAAGCIDSGNRGWDLGPALDPSTGQMTPSAWRGEHGGRIGFRCKAPGDVRLFVEFWDPVATQPGTAVELGYRFEAGAAGQTVAVPATERGIEVPAAQVGPGAPGGLLKGLTDEADRMYLVLPGRAHMITADFDISYAAHAHRIVQDAC